MMDVDDARAHPAARLVFDDDESVEVRTSDVLSEDANARVRVLTADVEDAMDVKMSAANAGKTKMGAATMFARLFGTDGERGSKRDRAASPAVKMNRRKAADGTRTQDLGRLARELAQQLDEPKVRLLARAINELGEAQVRAYVLEAATQQRHGGEMTALGDRRRTTGGIFWAIVRARTKPEVYDIIYAEERERQKERSKARARARRAAADGKENIPPVGHAKPTMAQILFGSIRDEHFPENRAPLAPIVVPIDAVTPKPTLKTVGWADDDEEFDFSAQPDLAAPMKTQKPDFTFAQIAKMR